MLPEECEKVFDSIIVGPGENNFLKAINEKEKKKYVESYNVVEFSDTPFPERNLLPFDSVISKNMFKQYGDYNATMVYFSRGCFYKCAYCVYNVPNKLPIPGGKTCSSSPQDLYLNVPLFNLY